MRRLRWKSTKIRFGIVLVAVLLCWQFGSAASQLQTSFVGSDTCRGCHESQHQSYMSFSKKAHSFEHVLSLKKGLTEAEYKTCLECHTTGYGKPGGFRSVEETPGLKNPGCEVCHGPGSLHVETEDPQYVKRTPKLEECARCHNEQRVEAFNYKPLIHGGAH